MGFNRVRKNGDKKMKIDQPHNVAFKKEVLENSTIFDDYDKRIIRNHISTFYCVFQLGWDAKHTYDEKELARNKKLISSP